MVARQLACDGVWVGWRSAGRVFTLAHKPSPEAAKTHIGFLLKLP
jgi:hypothetical protein